MVRGGNQQWKVAVQQGTGGQCRIILTGPFNTPMVNVIGTGGIIIIL